MVKLHVSIVGGVIQSLVGELRSHMPHDGEKKKRGLILPVENKGKDFSSPFPPFTSRISFSVIFKCVSFIFMAKYTSCQSQDSGMFPQGSGSHCFEKSSPRNKSGASLIT